MNVRSAFLILTLCCFLVVAFAQIRKPIDWFHVDANYQSPKLLLKHLQFTAPFPGYYQETFVDTDGNSFTGRVVPDSAVQGTVYAKLDDAVLGQLRQMLAQLSLQSTPANLQPHPGQLHTAFVFYDGHEFVRVNYNGPNAVQIDAILEILQKQFTAATQKKREEIAAHQRFIKETYGDWQSRAGITINAGALMHGCKNNRALVVSTAGQRKTDLTASPATVSVYHALIFYPRGVVAGSGSGGHWGNDPVQSYLVTWRLPNANGGFGENTSEQKLEIVHNAIDATITIAGKTYQLNSGNMFVIRIGDDWVPSVTQLNDKFEDQVKAQATLNRFKAIFKDDATIQALELY